MAGHEWEDWFEREEFIGQISDIRVQNLQGRWTENWPCEMKGNRVTFPQTTLFLC